MKKQSPLDNALEKTLVDNDLSPEHIQQLLDETVIDKHLAAPGTNQQYTSGDREHPDTITDLPINDTPRYSIGGLLGQGANGTVLQVQDNYLNRNIALKKIINNKHNGDLPQSTKKHSEKFLKEAQLTAQLEHPNVIPIYDVALDKDGSTFFTMRQISGNTFDTLIKSETPPNSNNVVETILKVCDALKLAHSKNIIHQDIKPANIIIGDFGEVFLADWGIGSSSGGGEPESKLTGTPLYMSPEQANKEQPDQLSDIYSLGATLFYSLTQTYPTHDLTAERFWQKKQNGIINNSHVLNSSTIPKPLCAIVNKALEAKPRDRYQSVADLANDIRSFQAGLSVGAYQDSLAGHLYRLYRTHQSLFLFSLIASFFIAIIGYFYYIQQQKEVAHWGEPIFTETFSDDSWQDNWIIRNGTFERKNGVLITKKDTRFEFSLLYKQPLKGKVAFEFEGKMLPNTTPGDLSIIFCDKTTSRNEWATFLQTGSFRNTRSAILSLKGGTLASTPFILKESTTYKIRGELDGETLRLLVNGKLICTAKDFHPPTLGYIGFYGYFPGKQIDNIKIYNKGVAEKIPVHALGNMLFNKKMYRDAIDEYEKIHLSHPSTYLADLALYKIALAQKALHDDKSVYKTIQRITNPEISAYAALLKYEQEFVLGFHDNIREDIRRNIPHYSNNVRQMCASLLQNFSERCSKWESIKYLKLCFKLLSNDKPLAIIKSNSMIMPAYLVTGHMDEIKIILNNMEQSAFNIEQLGKWQTTATVLSGNIKGTATHNYLKDKFNVTPANQEPEKLHYAINCLIADEQQAAYDTLLKVKLETLSEKSTFQIKRYIAGLSSYQAKYNQPKAFEKELGAPNLAPLLSRIPYYLNERQWQAQLFRNNIIPPILPSIEPKKHIENLGFYKVRHRLNQAQYFILKGQLNKALSFLQDKQAFENDVKHVNNYLTI